jgi:hypothetical protein
VHQTFLDFRFRGNDISGGAGLPRGALPVFHWPLTTHDRFRQPVAGYFGISAVSQGSTVNPHGRHRSR